MKLKTLFLLTFLLCSFISAEPKTEPKIKIGVSLPLSGNAAAWGEDIKNTLLFANKTLANDKYEFIFEDDQCSGKEAVTAVKKFTSISKVSAILGLACSSTVFSTASIIEQKQIPAIAVGASAPKISDLGDYIFRTWPSDKFAAEKLYDYIQPRHKVLGILTETTDYTEGFLNAVKKENKEEKIKIINYDFLSSTQDYKTLLLKLRSQRADAIFINTQTEISFLAVLKQLKQSGWKPQVYAAYFPGSPGMKTVLEQANSPAENSIYIDLPGTSVLTVEGKNLYKDFQAQYGKPQSIEILFATTFEAFRALYLAIESGKSVKDFLYQTKFQGLAGKWSFDKNGDIQGLDFVIKQIKNGEPVVLE